MRSISSEEAFLLFDKWSKNSRVGVNFGRRDAAVNFYLRSATLEVSKSSLLLEVKELSMTILHFDESVVFSELTREDVKREFASLHPVNPKFQSCVGAKFANQDFCLIFQE
jgi:hypothetical protein